MRVAKVGIERLPPPYRMWRMTIKVGILYIYLTFDESSLVDLMEGIWGYKSSSFQVQVKVGPLNYSLPLPYSCPLVTNKYSDNSGRSIFGLDEETLGAQLAEDGETTLSGEGRPRVPAGTHEYKEDTKKPQDDSARPVHKTS